jgi:hypothetical protein
MVVDWTHDAEDTNVHVDVRVPMLEILVLVELTEVRNAVWVLHRRPWSNHRTRRSTNTIPFANSLVHSFV